jgi:hypothetical protein
MEVGSGSILFLLLLKQLLAAPQAIAEIFALKYSLASLLRRARSTTFFYSHPFHFLV